VKTSEAVVLHDLGILGVSVPILRQGETVLVECLEGGNYLVASGHAKGLVCSDEDLTFDLSWAMD